jgi:hypothetical protein
MFFFADYCSKWKNGTYSPIQGDGVVTYWSVPPLSVRHDGPLINQRKYSGLQVGDELAVVPDDFRMLAGNISRNYLDLTLSSHLAPSFECTGPGFDCKHPNLTPREWRIDCP